MSPATRGLVGLGAGLAAAGVATAAGVAAGRANRDRIQRLSDREPASKIDGGWSVPEL